MVGCTALAASRLLHTPRVITDMSTPNAAQTGAPQTPVYCSAPGRHSACSHGLTIAVAMLLL